MNASRTGTAPRAGRNGFSTKGLFASTEAQETIMAETEIVAMMSGQVLHPNGGTIVGG
jgi:hypothetical protein